MQRIWRSFFLMLFSISAVFAGVGDPAPDFTLNKLSGGKITLSDFEGKIVYIFWFGYD